jgi:DNA-binding response OmpR family regulator
MKRLKPVVLAVEDDPDFRSAMESILNRFGVNAKGVSTPQDFLDAAEKIEPDLFLIDLQLGTYDGLDLIQKLRQSLVTKKPILVVSGSKGMTAITHALELGANDFILKPLDRTLLASKLSRYLKTDEIVEHRTSFEVMSQGRAPAKLGFEGHILAVDELGVKLRSKTLVSKGTAIKLVGELFKKLGIQGNECWVTVTSSWIDTDTKQYDMYAEFQNTDDAFLQSLRRWLTEV